jgi:hypothetical protein
MLSPLTETPNTHIYIMKKFDKIITVEVSVDSIAKSLLDSMSPDFKHRDLLVESIISPATNEINFSVGEVVDCIDTRFVNGTEGKSKGAYYPIGRAEIIEINLYSHEKLRVKFMLGEVESVTWVSHTSCSKIISTATETVSAPEMIDLSKAH